MNPLFSASAPLVTLSLLATALLLAVPLLFYGYLADRVWFDGRGQVKSGAFGPPDALLASALMLLFAANVASSLRSTTPEDVTELPSSAAMIAGVVLSAAIFLVLIVAIIGSLVWRHLPWRETFGLQKTNAGSVLARGALLILLAMPLIYGALAVSHVLLVGGGYDDDSPQELVRFLAAPGAGVARAFVVVSAVLIAPAQEEFLFRGYIYGVLRRYAGPVVGILVNALLFAAIHLHAPSFGGLFVLAVCLTLAYEWTGSLFVPITMHALFNSMSVINLLSGNPDS